MKPMGNLRTLFARVKVFLFERRANGEFDAEMQEHIRLLTERFELRGMSPQEAADAARRQFGNTASLEQRHREARTFLAPSELWRDVCFGVRMLRKSPGATAAVVIALALGIGMNSCVFTFVNALLLRPPTAVKSPGELREVWQVSNHAAGLGAYMPFNYPDYVYVRDHAHSFSGLLAFGDTEAVLWNHSGQGDVLHGGLVSGNFFSVAGVDIPLGRAFSQQDDQPGNPQAVVVLNHEFWRSHLAGDPAIVGKTMQLNGIGFTVVGVAPAGFTGLVTGDVADFWLPLSMAERLLHNPGQLTNRNSYWLIEEGRLAPGATTRTALAEAVVLTRQLAAAHPDTNKDYVDAALFTVEPLPGPVRGYVTAFTGLLMIVFGLVLVIACANAAGLMMVKATGRAREMAIRSALGAGRGRLIRQLTIESVLLSLLAGCAAIALAAGASRALLKLVPANLPITVSVPIDLRVLAFTFGVSLLTGIAFGVLPALRGTRVDPVHVLKEEMQAGGRRRSRLRMTMMSAQVAVCALLLFGAVLCVRSLLNANSINPGFETHNIATGELDPGSLGYSSEKIEAFYRDLTARMRAVPGVASVSFVNHLPLDAARERTLAIPEGSTLPKESALRADAFRVAPGYFSTMGIPMLRGRDFTQNEFDRNADAVVINDTLAAKLWPSQDPIGRRLTVGDAKSLSEVVGVVPTGKYRTIGERPLPALFRLSLPPHRVIVVRTLAQPALALDAIRRETQAVDPNMAATQLETIADFMSFPLFPARTTGLLLGAAGVLALILTWIGLFGVISHSVAQRTREIGVRMALGARRADVLRLVMRQGVIVTAIGLVIGMGFALAGAQFLSALLYGIRPQDPATVVAVSAALIAATLLACYLPARRAMNLDPTKALRYE
jgi:predicted permease